ncbi:MAG: M16 family metallopeptidase [Bryobacteraceae bacterium]
MRILQSHDREGVYVLIAATLLFPIFALAQAPPPDTAPGAKAAPMSKIDRKRKAPVSNDVLRVHLPKAKEMTLDDGLKILLIEDHRMPTVTVSLVIPGAGGIYDPPDMPGLASFTATMLKEGTTTRNSKQIAEQLDRLGASLFTSAGFNSRSASINISGLSDNMPEWMALAADIILNPTFPADELAKLKQRQKAQLQQQRSSPSFLVNERFSKAVFGDHPAARTAPTLASIEATTPEMLQKWHKERYVPQNAILGVAGDITADALMKQLANLKSWERTDFKVAPIAATKPVAAKKIYIVDRPGSVQTEVYLGNIAVSRTDPDYIPMTVMNRIIGGGPAARFFINLREEKGYTYGAYSRLDAGQWAGPWIAFASMRTDATEGAMTEFLKEIRRIREEPVPESELEEDKRSVVASFALSLESPAELLSYAMTQKLYGLPADYWDTYPSKLTQVTAEQVQTEARKYLDPDQCRSWRSAMRARSSRSWRSLDQ